MKYSLCTVGHNYSKALKYETCMMSRTTKMSCLLKSIMGFESDYIEISEN